MRTALIAGFVLLALAGCSAGTDPGPCLDPACLSSIGELSIRSLRQHFSDSAWSEEDEVTAWFGSPIGTGGILVLDAGEVRFNDRPLFRDGDYRLVSSFSDVPVRRLPSVNRWLVGGGPGVRAFGDTISLPPDRPALLSHIAGDTVRFGDTLELRWRSATATRGVLVLRFGDRALDVVLHEHDTDSVASGTFRLSPLEMLFMGVEPGYNRLQLVYRNEHEIPIGEERKVTSTAELVETYTIIVRE